jgi:hypothetical protein
MRAYAVRLLRLRRIEFSVHTSAEMPIMQEGPLRAARAHDQANGNARDHTLLLGASGRGTLTGSRSVYCERSVLGLRVSRNRA